MEYSGAGGKLIHEKNQKQKISWHCPFNRFTFLTYHLFSMSVPQYVLCTLWSVQLIAVHAILFSFVTFQDD